MKVIKIEYYSTDNKADGTTFELFNDIKKAYNFYKSLDFINNFYVIDLIEVNDDLVYYEDDGALNYEDKADLEIFNKL